MEEVVLVHDEPSIAPLVAEVLRSEGYTVKQVYVCGSPEEVERIRQQASVPLVIRTAHVRTGRTSPV